MTDTASASDFTPETEPSPPWFDELFHIDVRSLAALRFLLGLITIIDVAGYFRCMDDFFSRTGVVTSELSREYLGDGWWSLYFLDDSPTYAHALLFLTLLVAFAVMIGFRTRTMTFLCLILVWSLQVRDPMVMNGGHVLLRMLLFWSVFLPTNAIWSVDSYLSKYNEPLRWQVRSVATAAIMLQMAFMYFFSGLAKCNPSWFSGAAIEQVLGLEMYVKPAGHWLAGFPGLLRVATWAVLAVETVGPILIFLPRVNQFFRGTMMAFCLWMHLGIWITMDAGIFPLIAAAGWLVFLPSCVWEFFHLRTDLKSSRVPSAFSVIDLLPHFFCGAVLVYITIAHLVFAGNGAEWWRSNFVARPGRVLMVTQEFRLFGTPPSFSPSFEYQAELADGTTIDLFTASNPARRTKSGIYRNFENQQWRRIHSNLTTAPFEIAPPAIVSIRQRLLDVAVRNWNDSHSPAQRVESAKLICTLRKISSSHDETAPDEPEEYVEVWAASE